MKSFSHPYPWLHRFAVLTAFCTLALLGVGGLVTSKGVGMAVPDWPTTYGYNMFFFPISKWTGGIFYEHSHRLVASLVGTLTAILTAWIWVKEASGWSRNAALAGIVGTLGLMGVRTQTMFVVLASLAVLVLFYSLWRAANDPRPLRWWAMVAFTAVLVQGVLGGLRVTQYKDELGIFHGTLAQLFFALICSLAVCTSQWWLSTSAAPTEAPAAATPAPGKKLSRAFLITTILILLQLILGATMRHQHAGLAIPDFPLAYGKFWPATDTEAIAGYNARRMETKGENPITAGQVVLQMAHRFLALTIVVHGMAVAVRARRERSPQRPLGRLATAWMLLLLAQAGLGAWTVWSNKAADIATLHVLVGALSLVTGVVGCLICFRRTARVNEAQGALLTEASRTHAPSATI